jgi:serine/threonine protein kinase
VDSDAIPESRWHLPFPEEGQVLEVPQTGHQYRLSRRLGGGKFGEVWLAHVIKGSEGFPSEVAIKIAKPDLSEAERKAFENEPLTLHLLAATKPLTSLAHRSSWRRLPLACPLTNT